MEDQTDQLNYLKRMLELRYTHQQALDAWEKTQLSNRKIDSPAKNRPAREFLSGSVKLKTFIEYLPKTLNKNYWDDLIKIQGLESFLVILIQRQVLRQLLSMH